MQAGILKHPILIVKTKHVQDEYGSLVQEDSDVISTKCRCVHKDGQRTEENGEIIYPYTKEIQIRDYVPAEDYDEVQLDCVRYRILSVSTDEDYHRKTLIIEKKNE